MIIDALATAIRPELGSSAVVLLLVAIGVLVEGPVVAVVAGSLVGAGVLGWWTVWMTVVLADVASDTIFYAIGRAGGQPRSGSVVSRLGLTDERRDLLRDKIDSNFGAVVVGAKLIDIGAVPALLTIGLTGIPYRRLLMWVVPTAAVRVAALIGIGWLIGTHSADGMVAQPWRVVVGVAGVAILLLGGRLIWARVVARKEGPMRVLVGAGDTEPPDRSRSGRGC